MPNTAHLTELQAVNRMLSSIGEAPINSLESGLTEATIALEVLRNVSREIQMEGWSVNRWEDYTLTKNAYNRFVLGTDVLKVDTVEEDEGTPVVMKLSTDGTQYLLWDAKNHSETWATRTTLKVDIVYLLDFAQLTIALQHYILLAAGHEFQKGMVSSPVLYEFTLESMNKARERAEAEDSENDDTNVLRSSPTCYAMTARNNEIWGY